MRFLNTLSLFALCLQLVSVHRLHATGHSNSRQVVPQGMVKVNGGNYRPFYKSKDSAAVKVASFYMDVNAVTNAQFLAFVKANPKWAKSKVSKLFADNNYLKQWAGDFNLGK